MECRLDRLKWKALECVYKYHSFALFFFPYFFSEILRGKEKQSKVFVLCCVGV